MLSPERVDTLQAWNNLVEPKLTSFEASFVEVRDWIEKTSPKLLELDGFGLAVDKAIGTANEVAAHAEGRLRSEIGQVAMLIDRAIAQTSTRMDDLPAGLGALEISVSMPAAAAASGPPQAVDAPQALTDASLASTASCAGSPRL